MGRKGIPGGGVFCNGFSDNKGKVIQTIEESDETHDVLSETYELARRHALRIDDTLLEIKRALDNL